METICIETNRPQYLNDIGEVIRLFYGKADIVLSEGIRQESAEEPFLIRACVAERGSSADISAAASLGSDRESYSFPCDDFTPVNVKRLEKRAVKICVFRLLKRYCPVDTPWGSLTGIRPTKLFREIAAVSGPSEAERIFREVFDVSEGKTALASEIAKVQMPFIKTADEQSADIYFNIPFCKTKCLYCSFPSEILNKKCDPVTPYLDVLRRDILHGSGMLKQKGYRIGCMYIGGGTPTVLTAPQLDSLLSLIEQSYGSLGKEITVEAGRPDTIDEEKLRVLYGHGVQRISVNPQTMNDETLKRLGRTHTAAETESVFDLARKIGFVQINMDVICGLPGEGLEAFGNTLSRIEQMRPDNLTVHTLALKRSSRLMEHLEEYPVPDSSEVARMVDLGMQSARRMGMVPYYMYRQKYMNGNLENVGYALPQKVCHYNIDMMEETTNILAHGASAMTKRVYGNGERVERIPNPKDIPTYTAKLDAIFAQKESLF